MAAGDNEYPANNITRPRTAYGSPVYGSYADCIYEKYDYGGYGASQADGTSCGYAPIMAIVLNNDRAGIPSWFSGTNITDPTMTSAEACQKWCSIDACRLLLAQVGVLASTSASSSPCMTREDGGADCHDYVIWGFSDANWTGASGPGVCAGAGRRTTCSTCPSTSTGRVSGSTACLPRRHQQRYEHQPERRLRLRHGRGLAGRQHRVRGALVLDLELGPDEGLPRLRVRLGRHHGARDDERGERALRWLH